MVVVLALLQQAAALVGVTSRWPLPLLYLAVPGLVLAALRPGPVPARAARLTAPLSRLPAAALAGFVALVMVGAWAVLQHVNPLIGHDEGIYAARARDWAGLGPSAQWRAYRPVGLPGLGRLALAVHDSLGSLRVLTLLLDLLALGIVLVVGARWSTPRRATVAALVLLSGPGLLRRTPEFLNDIPASALLLVVAWAVAEAQAPVRSRAGRWWFLVAPVAALGAFYVRYGVTSALLALGLCALAVWGPRRWWAMRREVAGALLVFALGLLPHLIQAQRDTGSPLGILTDAQEVAHQPYPGAGLVYYAKALPFRLAGDLGALFMLAAVVAAVVAFRRLRRGEGGFGDRRAVFLVGTAAATVVLLGVAAHGEARFVFFPVMLATIVGVDAAASVAGTWRPLLLATTGALAVVTVAGTVPVLATQQFDGLTAERASLAQAGRAVPPSPGCTVVTSYEPEVGWYSGCATLSFSAWRRGEGAGRPLTLVLFRHGRTQPSAAEVRRALTRPGVSVRTLPPGGSLGSVTLVSVQPSGTTEERP